MQKTISYARQRRECEPTQGNSMMVSLHEGKYDEKDVGSESAKIYEHTVEWCQWFNCECRPETCARLRARGILIANGHNILLAP